jgi:hypothetical protein
MIFRAIFWIGLVALLMPHEPDLGFGRPNARLSVMLPNGIGDAVRSADIRTACAHHAEACASGLSFLDGFQGAAVRSLDAVRADIAANGHAWHTGI